MLPHVAYVIGVYRKIKSSFWRLFEEEGAQEGRLLTMRSRDRWKTDHERKTERN
jgi:hypothetical protein